MYIFFVLGASRNDCAQAKATTNHSAQSSNFALGGKAFVGRLRGIVARWLLGSRPISGVHCCKLLHA